MQDEGNPEDNSLTAIYQGKLTRELIGMIVKDAMKQRGISVRKAEEITKTPKSTIMAVRQGKATIDKGLSLLESLGFEVEAKLSVTFPETDAPNGQGAFE